MAKWDDHDMTGKIMEILREAAQREERHHLGLPFLTAYQIAIRFERLFPESFATLGLQVGGLGTGEHTSLAQYIARMLSARIKSGKIRHIEGGLLSSQNLKEVVFEHTPEPVVSSVTGRNVPLSMFRIQDA